jgi:tRNA 2-selenouridine synthase
MKFWTGGSPPGRRSIAPSDGFPLGSRLRRPGGTSALRAADGPPWLAGLRLVVLTGLTGAGKTALLHALGAAGCQTLDLEGLAGHRGSAFGGIGCGPQPSHRAFGERVRAACAAARRDRVLWVEDEGPFIGSVGVPTPLAAAMARAPAVEVRASRLERVDRVTREYGAASPEELLAALDRLRRRLGADRADRAAGLIADGRIAAAVDALLPYYDAAYRRRTAWRAVAGGGAPDVREAPIRRSARAGSRPGRGASRT